MRICCVGDSITEGPDAFLASYRMRLSWMLEAAGIDAEFVGPFETPTEGQRFWLPPQDPGQEFYGTHLKHFAPWPKRRHGGKQGDSIQLITSRLAGIQAAAPELVLLHAGQNNMGAGYDGPAVVSLWKQLIRDISNFTPRILVSTLERVHALSGTQAKNHNDFNRRLPKATRDLRAEGINVGLVSLHSTLAPLTDYADTSHPNRWGYDVIAGQWLKGIIRSDTPMNREKQLSLAKDLQARVEQSAIEIATVWLRFSDDPSGVNAPRASDTGAKAKMQGLALAVLSGTAGSKLQILAQLVALNPVVIAQSVVSGDVTDAAIDDAVYLAWRHVAGVTAADWVKP